MKTKYFMFFAVLTAFIFLVLSAIAYAEPEQKEDEYEIVFSESEIIETITEMEITIPFISPESLAELESLWAFAPQPQIFTPPGNMTLVDDFCGERATDKQFITVQTRNGHFFYIVIDRASGESNVHFLNQVDEFDLLAILSDEMPQPIFFTPIECTEDDSPETNTGREREQPPTSEQNQSSTVGIILLFVLFGAIGGGAYYYVKTVKSQQGTNKTAVSEVNEFDFDDDFDNTISNEQNIFDDDEDIPDFTASEELSSELESGEENNG
jgi:hypothetical protein